MLQPVIYFGMRVPALGIPIIVGRDCLEQPRRKQIAHPKLSSPGAILGSKGSFLRSAFATPLSAPRIVEADHHSSRDAGSADILESLPHTFARPDAILARRTSAEELADLAFSNFFA